jgi:hypothetical protein
MKHKSLLLVGAVLLATPVNAETLGFIMTDWDNAIYQSRFDDECPDGQAIGNDEYWWRWLPRAEKDRQTNKGLVQPVDRRFTSVFRGPKGEDVCWHPEILKEPPVRIAKGPLAFGFNLDGNADGAASPKSCAHENFASPDGTEGVDHQMFRLLGCHYGWKRHGVVNSFDEEERRNSGRGLVLIEVTGVDDVMNDDTVEVGLYRTIDTFFIDAQGNPLPNGSYRIDMNGGKPRYGDVAKGRIVDGVLTTDPVEVRLPYYGNAAYTEVHLKDMQLKLDTKPAANGRAKGLIGGYYDFDSWWNYMMKIEFLVATGDWSCPAMYETAKRLADGYPDPRTGVCTAISSAFNIEALPAFILHEQRTARE